jgi:hypothetical protein
VGREDRRRRTTLTRRHGVPCDSTGSSTTRVGLVPETGPRLEHRSHRRTRTEVRRWSSAQKPSRYRARRLCANTTRRAQETGRSTRPSARVRAACGLYRDEPRGSRERPGEDQSRRGTERWVGGARLITVRTVASGSVPSRSPSSGGLAGLLRGEFPTVPWCPKRRVVLGRALACGVVQRPCDSRESAKA